MVKVEKPKVSVIMNTLNENPKYLKQAIRSYLNQERVDVQLILSTVEGDKNVDMVRKMFKKVEIVEMKREDHPISSGIKNPVGAYLQLNNALPYIKGDWFCYASSNDFAFSDKLITEVEECLRSKKEVCYSNFNWVSEEGSFIKTMKFPTYNHKLHLQGNFVSDCSMISKRIVEEFLPFDVTVKNLGYWDLWLRVYKSLGNVFVHNNIPTWNYRQHSTSMRINRMKNAEKQKQELQDRKNLISKYK